MRKSLLSFLAAVCFLTVGLPASAQGLSEGFEGAFPPAGWATFSLNISDSSATWQQIVDPIAFEGNAFALTDYDCGVSIPSEDWLVTPQVAITSDDFILSWYHRADDSYDYGSQYIVMASDSSQTDVSTFFPLDTIFETDVPNGTWGQITYDLSAFIGQDLYIAIRHVQNCGDTYLIDAFQILGNCPPPGYTASVSNITQTTADITWPGVGTNTEVAVVENGNPATPSASPTTTGSFNATGLTAGTVYDVYIRNVCDGAIPIMISGVFDGPLPGGQPKGVELYVLDSIADLSRYGVSSANNGSGTTAPNPEFTFPAVSALPGDYIYLTSDSAAFLAYFGFTADYADGTANINGDDAIELFEDSVVVDVFGDVNTDGTGTPWEYLDGWAYRMPNTSPNLGLFDATMWSYSTPNALDGCVTNATCSSVVPIGSFTSGGFNYSNWVGPVTFTTVCPTTIPGDSAQNAIIVPTLAYSDTGNTAACLTSTSTESSSNDVWYFVSGDDCADSLFVDLCGSSFDTQLFIYDGNFGLLGDNDDSGPACAGLQSSVYLDIAGIDSIYILVEGFDSVDVGRYEINILQTLKPQPVATLSYPSDSVCEESVSLLPTVNQTGGAFQATAGLNINPVSGEIIPDTAGTFQVVYTLGVGLCVDRDTVDLTILPQVDAGFGYAADTVCDTLGIYSPLVTNTGGVFTGSPGLVIDTATGGIDLGASLSNQSFFVTYTTFGNCPDTDTTNIYIRSCLVSVDNALSGQFEVYPNPNQGQFYIANNGQELQADVEVLDLMGQSVFRKNMDLLQGAGTAIDLQSVAAGTYFLRIHSEGDEAVYRILISRD